jgi:nifR3 family TIM-barrel protein
VKNDIDKYMSFWNELKKKNNGEPLMVLAPLADVTDPAFRRLIAKYGKPDAMWTEFVSADGLFLGGYDSLIKDLVYSEGERPIIAQFFTSKPEMMKKAGELAVDLGFDGIDINMGCPDKSVEKQGAGAGLIKTPELAKEIILSAMEGAKKGGKNLPVSVKTRIGYNKNELETWLPILLSTHPALITVHARTRKEMSLVPARWEHVKRAVEIRDDYFNNLQQNIPVDERTLIFGNGDALDIEHAKKLAIESGADGVMLGRAIFGNPWLFQKNQESRIKNNELDIEERLNVLVEHTKLFEELCSHKSFAVMKKHYKAYVTGFDGAKELRMKLMECNNAQEVEATISDYLKNASK